MSGYGDGASSIADLNPSSDELAELAEVLDEVEAESMPGEADGLDYGDLDDPGTYGQAALSNSGYDVLDDITRSIGLANQRAAAAAGLAAVPLARRSEDRLAQLLNRTAAGMYDLSTPDGTGPVCGQGRDELGRCRAKYHDAACMEVLRGEAIAGSAQAMDSWRAVLLSNGRSTIELASATAELDAQTDAPLNGPNDLATYHAMRQLLGIGGR